MKTWQQFLEEKAKEEKKKMEGKIKPKEEIAYHGSTV